MIVFELDQRKVSIFVHAVYILYIYHIFAQLLYYYYIYSTDDYTAQCSSYGLVVKILFCQKYHFKCT